MTRPSPADLVDLLARHLCGLTGGPAFVPPFALGWFLTGPYAFLAGTSLLSVVKLIWAGITLRRYLALRRPSGQAPGS
jgi:hypothetical protein